MDQRRSMLISGQTCTESCRGSETHYTFLCRSLRDSMTQNHTVPLICHIDEQELILSHPQQTPARQVRGDIQADLQTPSSSQPVNMEIQQGQTSDVHWKGRWSFIQHIYSGTRHQALCEGPSKKQNSLAHWLYIVAQRDTGFTAAVSIVEKDGDSKCFRMCNFRAKCHLSIYNNTAFIVVFLSISQTAITLDTGKVWPGNSIWLIALTSELPAMSCHVGDLNFLLTKTPDPQVHKEPNVIRQG